MLRESAPLALRDASAISLVREGRGESDAHMGAAARCGAQSYSSPTPKTSRFRQVLGAKAKIAPSSVVLAP